MRESHFADEMNGKIDVQWYSVPIVKAVKIMAIIINETFTMSPISCDSQTHAFFHFGYIQIHEKSVREKWHEWMERQSVWIIESSQRINNKQSEKQKLKGYKQVVVAVVAVVVVVAVAIVECQIKIKMNKICICQHPTHSVRCTPLIIIIMPNDYDASTEKN